MVRTLLLSFTYLTSPPLCDQSPLTAAGPPYLSGCLPSSNWTLRSWARLLLPPTCVDVSSLCLCSDTLWGVTLPCGALLTSFELWHLECSNTQESGQPPTWYHPAQESWLPGCPPIWIRLTLLGFQCCSLTHPLVWMPTFYGPAQWLLDCSIQEGKEKEEEEKAPSFFPLLQVAKYT